MTDTTDPTPPPAPAPAPTAARVQIIHETSLQTGGWRLCLQWGRYIYDDGGMEEGYRFIWRKPGGNLQAARGQARIPSKAVADRLWAQAEAAGWANLGDDDGQFNGLDLDPH